MNKKQRSILMGRRPRVRYSEQRQTTTRWQIHTITWNTPSSMSIAECFEAVRKQILAECHVLRGVL